MCIVYALFSLALTLCMYRVVRICNAIVITATQTPDMLKNIRTHTHCDFFLVPSCFVDAFFSFSSFLRISFDAVSFLHISVGVLRAFSSTIRRCYFQYTPPSFVNTHIKSANGYIQTRTYTQTTNFRLPYFSCWFFSLTFSFCFYFVYVLLFVFSYAYIYIFRLCVFWPTCVQLCND